MKTVESSSEQQYVLADLVGLYQPLLLLQKEIFCRTSPWMKCSEGTEALHFLAVLHHVKTSRSGFTRRKELTPGFPVGFDLRFL